MRLSRVAIQNFRCLADVALELDNITVLIGENNSGKSSLLDAITLCLTRSFGRETRVFDRYDHHLGSDDCEPHQADCVSVTLHFVLDERTPDELYQLLNEVIVYDDQSKPQVVLRVLSRYDPGLADFREEWQFLNPSGTPLGGRARSSEVLYRFRQVVPIYYLSAMRDARTDFHGRSRYWSMFLRSESIPEDVRSELQHALDSLNEEVVQAHGPLQKLTTHLTRLQEVVSSASSGMVGVEALPGRISELLDRAQVTVTAATGAALPLYRHGSGMQSLAVIFLFEAYLSTLLAERSGDFIRPILALEEPEAHLHPCAVRSLWSALASMPGQKIIATHSGDLLARVPLSSIRRLCRENGSITVKALKEGVLTDEDERKVAYHVQSSRGELLFARCWILGEGETEYWVLSEVASLLGHDLERLGVRFVDTQGMGVEPLLKLAEQLGIKWTFIGDGDRQGKNDFRRCEQYRERRPRDCHVGLLCCPNIEVLLCEGGFGQIYERHVSPQKSYMVSAPRGSREYWLQVLDAKDSTPKPALALEVTAQMRNQGTSSTPPELRSIIDAAVGLAEVCW